MKDMTRDWNSKGLVTITSFETPEPLWNCPECNAALNAGVLGPRQEKIGNGSIVPCVLCGIEMALDAELNLRRPTPAEQFDADIYCAQIIDQIEPCTVAIHRDLLVDIPF